MTNKIIIDYSITNSFANLIGFTKNIYKPGTYLSQDLINISNINTINVECDLIQGGFYNGVKDNILYNFPSFGLR